MKGDGELFVMVEELGKPALEVGLEAGMGEDGNGQG